MRAALLRFELFFPNCHSLKEKRALLRPLIEGLRRHHGASVAEAGFQDTWQRSTIGVAVVSSGAGVLDAQVDRIRRYVAHYLEFEVVEVAVSYSEE